MTQAAFAVERYSQAISRALRWLHENEGRSASMPDLCSHYKAPYLYAAAGDPARSRRYADRIRARYLQADGDFRTAPDAKGWFHLPCSPANRYIYSNGWLVAGLEKMGAYGMAGRGLEFIRRFQSPELGGFRSRFDPATGVVDESMLDSSSTSSAGLALLACGQVAEARRAGDFLLRLLDAQPQPERFYFSSWKSGQGLMTDVFGEEDQNAIRGRKQFCLSTEADASGELVWLIGKPMKFLARLHEATGEASYLSGAVALFDFFHRLSESRWRNYASCKIMWGGAELYRHTGERRFGETAARILDWFVESQRPWGGWVHYLWYKDDDQQPFSAALDLAQELCAEMMDALFDLPAAPAAPGAAPL
ncbi:MAG: hypothetical protein KIT09_04960 [Bryobacteraceae bacterium]|nr:hypothetical protein [Bryobacteraceae bacterium]